MTLLPAHSWVHRRDEVDRFTRSLYSRARVKPKTAWILNLGSLERFAITVGANIYIPTGWSYEQAIDILPHEVGHVRQFNMCGVGLHPWVGLPLFGLLYLGLPFPILLGWTRYRLELHADALSWRHKLEHGANPVDVRARAQMFACQVGGWDYLFAVLRCWALWGFLRKFKRVRSEVLDD